MASFGGPAQDPLAALGDGEPGPLYYLYGKERFLIDRAVGIIKQRALEPATRDFNFEILSAREAGAARILDAARTLPMMARRRLLLVRDLEELKADELAILLPYVSAPCPETCLVFVGDKLDTRLKFFATLKKRALVLKLDPLFERQLVGFVREEARRLRVRLEAGVAELVAGEIGSDLGQLADAVERLGNFAGGRPVSIADCEQVVNASRQRTVFELANAIGDRSRPRALRALGSLLQARESAVRIVAMLARHVRQLWTARALLSRHPSRLELAGALGISPYFVDGIEAQARRLGHFELQSIHAALYTADKALKSSRLEDERLLEQLVLELTRKRSAA